MQFQAISKWIKINSNQIKSNFTSAFAYLASLVIIHISERTALAAMHLRTSSAFALGASVGIPPVAIDTVEFGTVAKARALLVGRDALA